MTMILSSALEKKAPSFIPLFENDRHLKLQVSRHVLVVDDDPDTAEAIKFMIESFDKGISCEAVCDPYEALLALSDQDFDLVLVDQKIPGLEGTQLLHKIDDYVDQDPLITESGRYSQSIPIVLMSGSDIHLPEGYKLRNFKIEGIINKSYLKKFLSDRFLE